MADITNDFIVKMVSNEHVVQQNAGHEWKGGSVGFGLGPAVAIPRGRAGLATRWIWFFKQVCCGGPWNSKINGGRKYEASGVIICGKNHGHDMPRGYYLGLSKKRRDSRPVHLKKIQDWHRLRLSLRALSSVAPTVMTHKTMPLSSWESNFLTYISWQHDQQRR